MRNKWVVPIIAVGIILTGCSEGEKSYEQLNNEIVQSLVNGEYENVYSHFSKELQQDMSIHDLQTVWQKQTEHAGDFVAISQTDVSDRNSSYTTVEAQL